MSGRNPLCFPIIKEKGFAQNVPKKQKKGTNCLLSKILKLYIALRVDFRGENVNIHLLMFDDRVERASCNIQKMKKLANESNGYDEDNFVLFGPYSVVTIELEDIPEFMKDSASLQIITNIVEYNPGCLCHKKGMDSGTAVTCCPVHD